MTYHIFSIQPNRSSRNTRLSCVQTVTTWNVQHHMLGPGVRGERAERQNIIYLGFSDKLRRIRQAETNG